MPETALGQTASTFSSALPAIFPRCQMLLSTRRGQSLLKEPGKKEEAESCSAGRQARVLWRTFITLRWMIPAGWQAGCLPSLHLSWGSAGGKMYTRGEGSCTPTGDCGVVSIHQASSLQARQLPGPAQQLQPRDAPGNHRNVWGELASSCPPTHTVRPFEEPEP